MNLTRSSKCSMKFATSRKLGQVKELLVEYQRVCQFFIDLFWEWGDSPRNTQLLKPVLDLPETWFSARLRKVAAREAVGLVCSAKSLNGGKPHHGGRSAHLGETVVDIQLSDSAEFDYWIKLTSLGLKKKILLPIRAHKHFNKMLSRGDLRKSVILREDSVQFVFSIESGPKKEPNKCVGLDTGINTLASLSTGERLGTDMSAHIDRVRRCKHGSKGHKRASRALRQYIDEVARDTVATDVDVIVVENLTGITRNTKLRRRLSKNIRRSIGSWNVRYWLSRIEQRCQDNRVAFRRVNPRNTSIICSCCGHVDRGNRKGSMFRCLKCAHEANADVQASRNILSRFLSGPYGAGCKAKQELVFTG